MLWAQRLFLAAAVWLTATQAASAAEAPAIAELACPGDAPIDKDLTSLMQNSFTPGVPWAAWADLLDEHWSPEAVAQNKWFVADEVMGFVKRAVPGQTAAPPDSDVIPINEKVYRDVTDAVARGENVQVQMLQGDRLYDGMPMHLDEATIKNINAYNAARQTLNAGQYAEAFQQIEQLQASATARDNYDATMHLIGIRAYNSGAPELMAAHYGEMKHWALAPVSAICHNAAMRDLFRLAENDLNWYLNSAFAVGMPTPGEHRRVQLDLFAQHDKFYDVLRAIAAPEMYNLASNWLKHDLPKTYPGNRRWSLAFGSHDAITSHARAQWLQTHNILWGYALAKRTASSDDLPLLQAMLTAVPSLPATPAVLAAKPALESYFTRHIIRLLLLQNKTTEALQLLRQHPVIQRAGEHAFSNDHNANAILNGGLRLFLERRDLEQARRWATEAGPLLNQTRIDPSLRPLLANTIDELLSFTVPGDGRMPPDSKYDSRMFMLSTLIDWMPTAILWQLSDDQRMSLTDRKAIIAAAWVRTYLLEGLDQAKTHLGALRRAFPELTDDINVIEYSWLKTSREHAATLMLLRWPGLGISPYWNANRTERRQPDYGRHSNIDKVDDYNPNDGNWWCPVDSDRMEIYLLHRFYIQPLALNHGWRSLESENFYMHANYRRTDNMMGLHRSHRHPKPQTSPDIDLAEQVIAWHPLLKQVRVDEMRLLAQAPSAPRLLTQQVLDWAKQSNGFTRFLGLDNDLPEALHRAVKTTHLGCARNGRHGEYSYAAYRVLHNRYPQSIWTVKTPYWYDITPHMMQ